MKLRRQSGNSTVEFVVMLTLLTAIGIMMMTWFTGVGGNGPSAIDSGKNAAITAIKND
jgi:hypothetical protein